jgi:hypothetical protein
MQTFIMKLIEGNLFKSTKLVQEFQIIATKTVRYITLQGYYKINWHFQSFLETKVLLK